MKILEPLNLTRLTNLEFGQHIKSVVGNITQPSGGTSIVTDASLLAYLGSLTASSTLYDKALVQIPKSDETAKIVASDKIRDTAITAAQRYLSVFELSALEAEQLAFASLDTLFAAYKGIQNWNFEEESNGIDNLVVDLQTPKYAASVATLTMATYVDRIAQANTDFKILFAKRTLETSAKEVFDIRAMRTEMKNTYTDMSEYVLSLAKVKDTDEFNQTLSIINTVRKYYSDMLVKQKPTKVIPPNAPATPKA
jgi:hypothetical protein